MALSIKEKENLDYMLFLAKQSDVIWWAEKEFGWRPLSVIGKDGIKRDAWYQYLLLACCDGIFRYPDDHPDESVRGEPIRKFVWRLGRQCIPKGTVIFDRDGSMLPIEEHPNAWLTKKDAELYEVKADNGYRLLCTGNHPFSIKKHNKNSYEMHGKIFCHAEYLTKEDEIETLVGFDKWGNGIIPYSYKQYIASGWKNSDEPGVKEKWLVEDDMSGDFVMDNEYAELLGFLTTDGNAGRVAREGVAPVFTNTDMLYLKRVEELVNKKFPDIRINWYLKPKDRKDDKIGYDLQFYHEEKKTVNGKNSIKNFIRKMHFTDSGFPLAVNYMTKEQVIHFVRGAWMGDGSFEFDEGPRKGNYRGIFSCCLDEQYTDFWKSLFTKLGFRSIKMEWIGEKSTDIFFTVRINGIYNLQLFDKMMGKIPGKELPDRLYNKRLFKKMIVTPEVFNPDGDNTCWTKVRSSVKSYRKADVYDVEFPGKGWFIANDIALSNSGKSESQSLSALYLAVKKPIHYTKSQRYKDPALIGTLKEDGTINETGWTERHVPYVRGAKIIVASADADKARTVFDRVCKFINESEKFKLAMESGAIEKKMTPFPELTFHVPGWTEPAWITFRGPGAGGQTARSKTFDYKLYDEADYIPPIFFEAEKATGINAGDNGLTILSSTPTGKRGYFYNACFVKNTPVNIGQKLYKNIQDIKIGDEVMNRYGVLEKVTDVMVNQYKGNIISIRTTKDKKIITATDKHKFMAVLKKDRLCKACDRIFFNQAEFCPLLKNHRHLSPVEPKYYQLKTLQIGDYLAIPMNLFKGRRPVGCFFKNGFCCVPITDYVVQNKSLEVYNLTVGEDHSYCVNDFGVANCTKKELNYFEIHAPSRENPRYTKQFDKDFRASLPMTTYQHEIEADWGTVEEGVFDWTFFEWVFRHYNIRPDLKDANSEIKTPIYRIFDTKNGTKTKPYPDEYEKLSLDAKNIEKIGYQNLGMWLKKRFPEREDGYAYWFGADFGYQADPSELLIAKERNGILKLVLRIHLEHVEYMTMCEIIALLDLFYQFQALGMDEGSSGAMIKQVLQGQDENSFNKYKKHNFLQRLFPVNFSQTVDIIDNYTKESKKIAVKQFMTDSIIINAQNKQLIMPSVDIDSDLENQFRNHTYTIGANGTIIYSKSNICPDHAIDALRTLYWAKAQTKRPSARKLAVGSTFRSRGGTAWG